MKLNRTTLIWGLGAALAIGALAWAFAPRPAAVEVATARQAPFEQWIEEDGQTRLRDRYASRRRWRRGWRASRCARATRWPPATSWRC